MSLDILLSACRKQYVRLSVSINSRFNFVEYGFSSGDCFGPIPFTVYPSDLRSTHPSCPLVKCADDTALISLIENDDDSMYREQISRFVNYCDENYLVLNVKKTKEMIIDFRVPHRLTSYHGVIMGSAVERVTEFKYLGDVIDEKLKWNRHIEYVVTFKAVLFTLLSFTLLKLVRKLLPYFITLLFPVYGHIVYLVGRVILIRH